VELDLGYFVTGGLHLPNDVQLMQVPVPAISVVVVTPSVPVAFPHIEGRAGFAEQHIDVEVRASHQILSPRVVGQESGSGCTLSFSAGNLLRKSYFRNQLTA
jgi:hypothetical protein